MNDELQEPLEVLYQDAYFIAINKPSGLLVHKSPIDKHETRFALQEIRDQLGQYVYPVHRLDKPTSGVLLFALSKEINKILSNSFRQNEVKKEYIAIVRGYTETKGYIDYPLKQMLDTKLEKKRGTVKEEQTAQTYYERVDTVELPYAVSRYLTARYSLIKLYPQTGRKHQLRRHMKHIHHHMIGDTKHGRGEHNKLFRKKFGSYRLLLHALSLHLKHPVTQKEISISAGIDNTFRNIFESFGWDRVEY